MEVDAEADAEAEAEAKVASEGPEDALEKDLTAPMEQIEIEIASFDHVNLFNENVDLP